MDANVQARLDEIESAFVETETMLSVLVSARCSRA